jgi:hypothetical protein
MPPHVAVARALFVIVVPLLLTDCHAYGSWLTMSANSLSVHASKRSVSSTAEIIVVLCCVCVGACFLFGLLGVFPPPRVWRGGVNFVVRLMRCPGCLCVCGCGHV